MSALSDVLSMLARDARRIAVSADAEVTTTTRAGVVSVRVTDGGVTLLSATLDTRPRVEAPRAEQLAFADAVMLTPPPVAVPAGEERDEDAPAPQGEPVRCWIFQPDWDNAQFRDAEAEGWLCEPVAGTVLDWAEVGPWESVLVPAGVLDSLRKVCRRVGVTLHEGDDIPPVPAKAEATDAPTATDAPLPEGDELVDVVLRECPTTMRGLDVVADGTGRIVLWAFASKTSDELVATVPADLARMIQAKARAWWGSWCAATRPASVVTVGGDAPTLHGPRKVLGVAPYDDSCDGIVLATPRGPQVAWLDNVSLERGVATVHPSPAWEVTQGADGTWLAERLPDETKKPKRAAKATKTAPARNVPVPQADAIAQSYRGAIVIVWQVAEGAAWERVWSEPSPKAAAIESAWQAACEAHRARQYNRGGKCTRDSQDGAA